MRRTLERSAWIWAAVALLATSAQAVTIINRTTGQVLFYDDFEAVPAVSQSAYPDVSGDYDPAAPQAGVWSIQETGATNIQVTSYFGDGTNDPAATPQGTNYLRAVRHMAAVAEARMVMPAVQSAEGDVIHMETMVWIPKDVNWGAFQIQVLGSGGSTDFRANVIVDVAGVGSGAVRAWDATLVTPSWVHTLRNWTVNTWQKWEIDYAVGAETFDLTLDGVKVTLNHSGAAGDVKYVAFRCGSPNANSQFRLDATGFDGSKQDSFTLFRDGFEGGTPDSAPTLTLPEIGTYLSVGSGVKVRTGDLSASGGPTAASSGNNYVELSRLSNAGLSLTCAFAGGAVLPDAREIRANFNLWWGGAGLPGHGLTRATTGFFYPTNFLAYNLIRDNRSYDAFNGTAYQQIAPPETIPLNVWFPIELAWYPETQAATVSINGAEPVTNVLFGTLPEVVNQLFLSSGNSATVYWADDIEVRWVYTQPPPPPPKGTLLSLQ
jgi:hypothetical protein